MGPLGTNLSTTLILAAFLVNGIIGAFLGKSVGKVGLGAILGTLLGPIGWVIVLLLPRDQGEDTASIDSHRIRTPVENQKISFAAYKKQQKLTRPGFSHMSHSDQKKEWMDHLEAISTKEQHIKPKNDASKNSLKFEPHTDSVTLDARNALSIEERLSKVSSLVSAGLITEEEASSKRSKILEDL